MKNQPQPAPPSSSMFAGLRSARSRRRVPEATPAAPDTGEAARPAAPPRVALLCNPLAGGRWKVLAEVLDSPEARLARRIVTDEIHDVRSALADLGRRVDLLCIYGGDGTIYRILNELVLHGKDPLPRIALLGGGTMNVTARACGMSSSPAENFRAVMRAYSADQLTWREVPLLDIGAGDRRSVGFTFGVGPLIRLLERYESGKKGVVPAALLAARSVGAAVLGKGSGGASLREMNAEVHCDGEALPYRSFSAIFCNTTGTINPHVKPFVGDRCRDSFHFLAYAASSRSFALLLPLLARGHLPVDPQALRRPLSAFRRGLLSYVGAGELPIDPRFINHKAREVEVTTDEQHYTIDGEILPVVGPIPVRLGPAVRLAVLESRGLLRP